ncbi:MAG: phosphoglycolate phosphatase [Hyphomicrobiales bacterium]|nr:phosphoglycolate phosphatase [Hyphomicrobiales bacterium]
MDGLSVVFDLDGTMVDTAPDLIIATNRALSAFNMDTVSEPIVKRFVGHGSKAMLRAAVKHLGHDANESELDRMAERFVAYYSEHLADESRPFPGFVKALTELREGGALLGVCTNKRENLSLKLLQTLDLHDYFSAVLGADTIAVRKPDPEHLLETIARIGGDSARAVMVGDSETDAKTAKAAGIPFIAVSFGYRNCAIEELKADVVIDHYDELIPALRTLK